MFNEFFNIIRRGVSEVERVFEENIWNFFKFGNIYKIIYYVKEF